MENILIEILRSDGSPAEPGEIGDIVVTDLHNYGMPFIRYKIGDMGMWAKQPCSCGRAHPLLEDIVGRSLDMLYGVDGRRVPGEFFPHMLKDFSAIRQFQVIQKKRNQLLIKIILRDGQSDFGQPDIEREIKQVMGERMKCTFEIVDEIPLTRTGKFRVTLSEIPEDESVSE
jgi:phenylacetate-CoA ligase